MFDSSGCNRYATPADVKWKGAREVWDMWLLPHAWCEPWTMRMVIVVRVWNLTVGHLQRVQVALWMETFPGSGVWSFDHWLPTGQVVFDPTDSQQEVSWRNVTHNMRETWPSCQRRPTMTCNNHELDRGQRKTLARSTWSLLYYIDGWGYTIDYRWQRQSSFISSVV